MAIENDDPAPSRRDVLMASMEAIENEDPAPAPAVAATATVPADPAPAPAEGDGRVRDASGRFAPGAAAPAIPVVAAPAPAPELAPPPAPASLTTWKKEFLPLHEKLNQGLPLTAEEAKLLAGYNVQREREYSTGISGYKAEAQTARAITDVMQEFMPALQKSNMHPAQWIQNMGRAHATLVYGSPEQKIHMFSQLAQEYGVPLGAVGQVQAGGQVDPNMLALMQQIQSVQQSVSGITSAHQQREQQEIHQQLSKFEDASQYPHFAQVRGMMAQLLESGLAQDLDQAYTKAVRMDDQAWQAEQSRQASAQASTAEASRQAAIAKAKQSAGQVRAAAPVAAPASGAKATDRRAILAEQFDSVESGRV